MAKVNASRELVDPAMIFISKCGNALVYFSVNSLIVVGFEEGCVCIWDPKEVKHCPEKILRKRDKGVGEAQEHNMDISLMSYAATFAEI